MSLLDPRAIRPRGDNVLVQLDAHANAQAEERRLASGLYVPKIADHGASAGASEAVPAIIVAAGPGRWTDTWRDQQKGSVPYGDGAWLPTDEHVCPGAHVMVDSPLAGDRVYSQDSMDEYRMVHEENIVMLLGDEPTPLGDRVLVVPDRSERRTESGLWLGAEEVPVPTSGEIVAVGQGKMLPDGTRRSLEYREGDMVLFGRYSGIKVMLEGVELKLLRDEDVLGVVAESSEQKKTRAA